MLIKFFKFGLSITSLSTLCLLGGCLANNPSGTPLGAVEGTSDKETSEKLVANLTETAGKPATTNPTKATEKPVPETKEPTVPVKPSKPPVTTTAPVPLQQGGIQQISSAQLQTLLNDGVTLVDIRRPDEWEKTGVIKGSNLLTFFDTGGVVMPSFFREVTDIVPKGKPIALICDTGSRTRVASEMMARAGGYGTIYNVEKGVDAWIKEGREITTK